MMSQKQIYLCFWIAADLYNLGFMCGSYIEQVWPPLLCNNLLNLAGQV